MTGAGAGAGAEGRTKGPASVVARAVRLAGGARYGLVAGGRGTARRLACRCGSVTERARNAPVAGGRGTARQLACRCGSVTERARNAPVAGGRGTARRLACRCGSVAERARCGSGVMFCPAAAPPVSLISGSAGHEGGARAARHVAVLVAGEGGEDGGGAGAVPAEAVAGDQPHLGARVDVRPGPVSRRPARRSRRSSPAGRARPP